MSKVQSWKEKQRYRNHSDGTSDGVSHLLCFRGEEEESLAVCARDKTTKDELQRHCSLQIRSIIYRFWSGVIDRHQLLTALYFFWPVLFMWSFSCIEIFPTLFVTYNHYNEFLDFLFLSNRIVCCWCNCFSVHAGDLNFVYFISLFSIRTDYMWERIV